MNTLKNPYVGPRTFQRDEGHLFFGREREARDLISLVAVERLVVFYAQSGAGKSSIVNTRLIPDLEGKEYEVLPVGRVSGDTAAGIGVNNIYIYNLLRSLEQHEIDPASLSRLSLAEFLCQLNFDEKGFFYDVNLSGAVSGEDEDGTIIRRALIIDQFEELFSTHPEAWEKREEFFRQIAQAMQDDPHLWVVLVMREDYIAHLDPYAHLLPNGLRVRYYMQRLGREAAIKAVKSPVEGIRPYAKDVAEKLIADLCSIKVEKPNGEPDFQPGQYVEPVQLQVVCYGLWENLSPEGTQITEKDLEDVGDVNQSLGKYYDKRVGEVARAKNVRERLIREWFEKKLITAGGIRNMVLQERETKPGELDDDVIQALQSDLVRAEKRGGATWYELTHDRLVEPILERNKIWFNENLSPLQRQAALWKDQDQHESWLLRDQALLEVEAWAAEHQDELTETEDEFLEACQKMQAQIEERHAVQRQQLEMANKLAEEQARSAKRARTFNIISAVLVVVAIVATFLSIRSASDAREQSNIARSSELSTVALDKAGDQLDLAILLGLQANAINSNTRTENTLLSLLQKSGRYKGSLPNEVDIQQIQYSPDGTIFATLGKDGITLWDAGSLKPVDNALPINGHSSGVSALAISHDGQYLAVGGTDGTVTIWNAVTHQSLSKPIKTHEAYVDNLTFNNDDSLLAAASSAEGQTDIILLNVSEPANPQKIEEALSEHNASILSLAFSPNGETLASGSYDSAIVLWDVKKRKVRGKPIIEHTDWVNDLTFNDSGTLLASASDDNRVILWDVSNPENPSKQSESISNEVFAFIHSVAISPDGETLAMGNFNGPITLWDISDPAEPLRVGEPFNQASDADIFRLAFDSTGTLLASSSADGAFTLWDVANPLEPRILSEPANGSSAYVYDLIFNDSTLITGSDDSRITSWDVSSSNGIPKITNISSLNNPSQPIGMQFSSNGRLLESYSDNAALLIDVQSRELLGLGSFWLSPDGTVEVYQKQDKSTGQTTIHLTDAISGEEIGEFAGYNPVFSPDGHMLVYQTMNPETGGTSLNLWDISSAQNIGKDINGYFTGFSPDNSFLVYKTKEPSGNKVEINLWDIAAKKNIKLDSTGNYLTLSPDNQSILYSTYDASTDTSSVYIQNIATGEFTTLLTSYYDWSEDGGILAYATHDEEGNASINVLHVSSPDLQTETFDANGQNFGSFDLSTDGKLLTYTLYDEQTPSTYILDAATGNAIGNPIPGYISNHLQQDQFLIYEFNNNGETGVVLIDTGLGRVVKEVKGSFSDLLQDSEISDGNVLVYQTIENSISYINLWDIDNDRAMGDRIKGGYLDISPDGGTLVTRNEANSIIFFDLSRTWPVGEPIDERGDVASNAILSPDGKTLAWVNNDGIVLEDVTGEIKNEKPFYDHFGNEFSGSNTVFSPDGTLIAIGNDSTLTTTVWDLKTQTQVGSEIPGVSPLFSPDGSWLLVRDWNAATITLWDAKTFEQVQGQFSGTDSYFSPSGGFLMINNWNTSTSTVLDLETFERVGDDFRGWVNFSPDDSMMVVQDQETLISTLWDLSTRKPLEGEFPGWVWFSPDGKLIVSVYENEEASTTSLWDLSTMEKLGEDIPGNVATFSSDGTMLAVGDWRTSTVTLWEIDPWSQIGEAFPGDYASFSPNGSNLAVVSQGSAGTTVWDIKQHKPVSDEIPGDNIYFSPDGKFLAVWSNQRSTSTVWKLDPFKQVGEELAGWVFFTPDSRFMARADESTLSSTVWDLTTESQIGDEIDGTGASFSPDGRLLAVSNWNAYTTTLWELNSDQARVQPINGHALAPTTMTFSPDGRILASLASDGIVLRDLDANTTRRLDVGDYEGQLRDTVSFSPDNKQFIALGDDGTLLIWDLAEKSKTLPAKIDTALKEVATGLCEFSIDGKYLVYKSDNSLQVWDVLQGKPYGKPIAISGNIDTPEVLTFSPDGKFLSYTNAGTVYLYDFPNFGKKEELPIGTPIINDVALLMGDSGIRYLVTLDDAGYTQLWDWTTRTKVGDPMSGISKFVGSSTEDRQVIYIDASDRLIKFKSELEHADWQDFLCPLAGRNFSKAEWDLYVQGDYPEESLTCPAYPSGQSIASPEATNSQQVATQTEGILPTTTPAAVETALPTFEAIVEPTSVTTTGSSLPTEPPADISSLIQSANILLYEDTAEEGLWIEKMLQDAGYVNATFVHDRLGNLKTQLASTEVEWDLIIIATEAHGAVSGGFWDSIKGYLDEGTAVIIETRTINLQGEGRLKPILDACGVELQSNLELAVPLKWYQPDSPIFNSPNTVGQFSGMSRHWETEAGDLMQLKLNSDATILAGTSSTLANSGVIVSCYDGRMILQTFANHDYPQASVSQLWQNYVYNVLLNRFSEKP